MAIHHISASGGVVDAVNKTMRAVVVLVVAVGIQKLSEALLGHWNL